MGPSRSPGWFPPRATSAWPANSSGSARTGPGRAGTAVTLWTDITVVHLLANGGRPASPPPILAGDAPPGTAIEVDRLVSANGLIGLAGRRYSVGIQFAGRRVTVRLDRGLLQLVDNAVLLRSLPNPAPAGEQARIRDARPAGPSPAPAAGQLPVDRCVSCRGALVVVRQRIHVRIAHTGRTPTVEAADHTRRVYDGDHLVAEVARTTTRPIARFKVHKPEPRCCPHHSPVMRCMASL